MEGQLRVISLMIALMMTLLIIFIYPSPTPPCCVLQAAPCWPPRACQAWSSCRSWKSWSWPIAPGPRLSSSSTTPSTCPTAWSSNNCPAGPAARRAPHLHLPPPHSSSSSLSRRLDCPTVPSLTPKPHLTPPISAHLPLHPLTHRQRGRKADEGTRQIPLRGRWDGVFEFHWRRNRSEEPGVTSCPEIASFFWGGGVVTALVYRGKLL